MISGATTVLRAEVARLLATRAFHGAVALVAVAAAARAFLAGASLPANGVESGAGWHGLAVGLQSGLVLSGFVLVFVAARGLAGDAHSWVLRLALTRCASRGGVVAARLGVGALQLLVLTLASLGGALAGANLSGDFGPLVLEGYELCDAALAREGIQRVLLAALPALAALHAFGLAVSALCSGAVQAVALAFGILLSFDLFKGLLGSSSLWLFPTHAPTLVDSSAFGYAIELTGLGPSTAMFDEPAFRIGLVACAGWWLLLGLASRWILGRRTL